MITFYCYLCSRRIYIRFIGLVKTLCKKVPFCAFLPNPVISDSMLAVRKLAMREYYAREICKCYKSALDLLFCLLFRLKVMKKVLKMLIKMNSVMSVAQKIEEVFFQHLNPLSDSANKLLKC